jgi:hypothetical protein
MGLSCTRRWAELERSLTTLLIDIVHGTIARRILLNYRIDPRLCGAFFRAPFAQPLPRKGDWGRVHDPL